MFQKKYLLALVLATFCLPSHLLAQQHNWEVGVEGGASQIHYVVDGSRFSTAFKSEKEIIITAGADLLQIRSG